MLEKAMQLQLAHWLIITGMSLVTIGTIGLLFRRQVVPSFEQPANDSR